eukprot:NODE_3811_length_520_cov_159.407643_g3243_i0.p3 GENE.NODE_3811_length_520_cov_159.407643_g3243_i0~~NODE_3811_length_520_cov_159.407643_g3243_i0.p3  ORF type:complete len:72 (+),score=6.59 NODE_3811_length_520_cov_159.407643_g3243_i0:250-465(+)
MRYSVWHGLWKNVVYFSSIDDLLQKLSKADLPALARAIRHENIDHLTNLSKAWSGIISQFSAPPSIEKAAL